MPSPKTSSNMSPEPKTTLHGARCDYCGGFTLFQRCEATEHEGKLTHPCHDCGRVVKADPDQPTAMKQ